MADTQEVEIPTGPYLAAAVLSDAVLEEQSGLRSIIRISDHVTIGLAREPKPGEAVDFSTVLFIMFRAGDYEGFANLDVRAHSPIGQSLTSSVPLMFEGKSRGPYSGASLNLTLKMALRVPGLYWFDLFLNNAFVTRVPLQVKLEQAEPTELQTTVEASGEQHLP